MIHIEYDSEELMPHVHRRKFIEEMNQYFSFHDWFVIFLAIVDVYGSIYDSNFYVFKFRLTNPLTFIYLFFYCCVTILVNPRQLKTKLYHFFDFDKYRKHPKLKKIAITFY